MNSTIHVLICSAYIRLIIPSISKLPVALSIRRHNLKSLLYDLHWTSSIQIIPSQIISLWLILILFSHVHTDLLSCLFSWGFPTEILYGFLVSSLLAECQASPSSSYVFNIKILDPDRLRDEFDNGRVHIERPDYQLFWLSLSWCFSVSPGEWSHPHPPAVCTHSQFMKVIPFHSTSCYFDMLKQHC
jgi:hypothetical protein